MTPLGRGDTARPRRFGAEHLLPLACVGAAGMLAASQFMDIFEINGAPGQTFDVITAADQHWYVMVMLGGFAILAVLLAVSSGSPAWAAAVATAGVTALILILLIDVPDAGKVGTLDNPDQSFFEAEAEPAAGFWVELAGALILAICGGALATLSPDQLRSFRLSRGAGAEPPPAPMAGKASSDSQPATATPAESDREGRQRPSRVRGP
jgi:hypothetical protein